MKFTTSAAVLAETLATARAAVPTRPTMSAFTGVLLAVRGNALTVTGSDGDTTISAHATVEGTTDGHALLLPRPIGAYLATRDPAAQVTVTVPADGADVSVEATGALAYTFRQLTTTFPNPTASRTGLTEVSLTGLSSALAAVRLSVNKDEPGVQLVSGEDDLVLRSTDSYRLTQAILPHAGFGDFTGIVPLPVLEQLARHDITHVFADPKGRLIRCSGPKITVTARLLSTPFPPVTDAFLADPPQHAHVPADALRRALHAVEAVADKSPVTVTIAGDELRVSASNQDVGAGGEVITLDEPATTDVTLMFNLRYLTEAVSCHDQASTVTLSWSGTNQPLHVTGNGRVPVRMIVMPMRSQ